MRHWAATSWQSPIKVETGRHRKQHKFKIKQTSPIRSNIGCDQRYVSAEFLNSEIRVVWRCRSSENRNCTVVHNEASRGAGITVDTTRANILARTFIENHADGADSQKGGGALKIALSNVNVYNCEFADNEGGKGGAVVVDMGVPPHE